jgi:sterol desaturase/sphingolipid hydroxylase (fatty acid hydroxylase superfamily)
MPIYVLYYFWLLVISASVLVLERLFPWRREQEVIREGFVQDLFWLVFNIQYMSWMLAILAVEFVAWFDSAFLHLGVPPPSSLRLVSDWPLWLQFVVFFVVRDFLEWNVHRWMHVFPRLWKVHQLHHSSEQLDWLATFRSHWGEVAVYRTVLYLPLVILGVNEGVIFSILVFALLIQELSHANLRWDYGPLRYVLNSPRFHAWHHADELHGKGGQNFGVTLVLWDWLFGTAYWPGRAQSPARYGFEGMERFPRSVWGRLWYPFLRNANSRSAVEPAAPVEVKEPAVLEKR